jgi:putative copper resistance protein D
MSACCADLTDSCCSPGWAAFKKWRLTPALAAGTSGAAARLRRSIALEYALLLLVLTLTAALTTFYSPEA